MNNLLQILSLAILLTISSCTNQGKVAKQYSYFDIEGYFEKEALRLKQANPHVVKSVKKNSEIEERKVHINDWGEEFSLFSASDINKPAWKNSYKKYEKPRETWYISTDPNLRTEKILIQREENGTIVRIFISNKVSNSLYTSKEGLNYYPDSLYQIYKEQKVRLLGTNDYTITGKLK